MLDEEPNRIADGVLGDRRLDFADRVDRLAIHFEQVVPTLDTCRGQLAPQPRGLYAEPRHGLARGESLMPG